MDVETNRQAKMKFLMDWMIKNGNDIEGAVLAWNDIEKVMRESERGDLQQNIFSYMHNFQKPFNW